MTKGAHNHDANGQPTTFSHLLEPEQLLHWLYDTNAASCGSIVVVAVDGRSGSGKSTLARSLAKLRDDIAVIASDDVAWHHSFFDWDVVARTQLLEPLARYGPPLSLRPAPWIERDRPGAITIPAGTSMVLFEGVGTGRVGLFDLIDHVVWVDVDEETARERLRARGGSDGQLESSDFVESWLTEERTFLQADRPWTRASVIVSPGVHPDIRMRTSFPTH